MMNSVETDRLESKLENKYPVEVHIYENALRVRVSTIFIKKQDRNQGTGEQVMREIQEYAASVDKLVTLTASTSYGGHMTGLKRFYKRLGFKPNKGRNKDYRFRDTFIWAPERTT